MTRDRETIQALLYEMVETPSVVRITKEDAKLFTQGLVASDCRCLASDPEAFVKVIEQLEKDCQEILNVHDCIQKMIIYVYDTKDGCIMLDDMPLLHAFKDNVPCKEFKWGIGVWRGDEIRVVVIYQPQSI